MTPSDGTRFAGRVVPQAVRTHPFVTAAILAALVGGGLRLVPASNAALPGSSASAAGGASTACSAQ